MKKTKEIKEIFLNFFKRKNHIILPSSSLIPKKNDSSLLFTNAGMNQFKKIFTGEEKIQYNKIATAQKCIRMGGKKNDFENVGKSKKHHTFFEMLGNFSFGAYYKKKAILYAWELLTKKKWFFLPKKKFFVTVYKTDLESYKIWNEIIKLPKNRIFFIGDKKKKYHSDNFWKMGETGPCGPCTEIYYDNNNLLHKYSLKIDYLINKSIEIWNIVFIEFNLIKKNQMIPLSSKFIDTGMGLERITSIIQKVNSTYKIDIFQKVIAYISTLTKKNHLNNKSQYIIADHIRSSIFIILEGIIPSNEGRGYVLRKIIRRAIYQGIILKIKKFFLHKIVAIAIKKMNILPKKDKKKEKKIKKILKKEEKQFYKILKNGYSFFKKKIKNLTNKVLDGQTIFYLYDTFGFPIDLIKEICEKKNIQLDLLTFTKHMEKQKKKSKINNPFKIKNKFFLTKKISSIFDGYKKNKIHSKLIGIFKKNKYVKSIKTGEKAIIFFKKTPFYPESGGQVGDSGTITYKDSIFIVQKTKKYASTICHIGYILKGKLSLYDYSILKINKKKRKKISNNHTATHILNFALRKTLNKKIIQKGSSIDEKKLTFDFTCNSKINLDMLEKIEKKVNKIIFKNILLKFYLMDIKKAKRKGAIYIPNKKYAKKVKVISIGKKSLELCGGTHAKRTGDIGCLKILYEKSVSQGVRRIKAITGIKCINHFQKSYKNEKNICNILHTIPKKIKKEIKKRIKNQNTLKKNYEILKNENIEFLAKKLKKRIIKKKNVNILISLIKNYNHNEISLLIKKIKYRLNSFIIVIFNTYEQKTTYFAQISKNLVNIITAEKIIKTISKKINGNGGGKPIFAKGGVKKKVKNFSYLLKIISNNIFLKLKSFVYKK